MHHESSDRTPSRVIKNLKFRHAVVPNQVSQVPRLSTNLIGPIFCINMLMRNGIFLFLLKTKTHFLLPNDGDMMVFIKSLIEELIDLISQPVRYINLSRARTV